MKDDDDDDDDDDEKKNIKTYIKKYKKYRKWKKRKRDIKMQVQDQPGRSLAYILH